MKEDKLRILNYLKDAQPEAIKLILKMRKAIGKYLPDHQENLRWQAIAYDKPNPSKSVKDNICSFKPSGKSVKVGIPLGVFFTDPDFVLEGNLRYKRYITVKKISDFDNKSVRDIILQSYQFDSNTILYKKLPKTEYSEMASKI